MDRIDITELGQSERIDAIIEKLNEIIDWINTQ